MKLYLLCLFVAAAMAESEPAADAEADPALLLRYGYSGLGYPYGARLGYYGGSWPYAASAAGHHWPYAASVIGKRSADPEPEPQFFGKFGRFGLARRGFFGRRSFLGRGRFFGKRSADSEAEPTADAAADPALLVRYGYGLGYPYASSLGYYGGAYYGGWPYAATRYIGKRSADPAPEPQFFGRKFGLGRFGGIRRGSFFGGRKFFGKRSADSEAEPEADAEADPALLLRAGYGYGYPYGVGLGYYGGAYYGGWPYGSRVIYG